MNETTVKDVTTILHEQLHEEADAELIEGMALDCE